MNSRDLMAPDTDPTDEELEIVAKEALQVARVRRAESEKQLAEALRRASIEAELHASKRHQREDDPK